MWSGNLPIPPARGVCKSALLFNARSDKRVFHEFYKITAHRTADQLWPHNLYIFDGWGWDAGYIKVPYAEISSLVKTLQPNCILIENNHEYTQVHSEIVEYEMPIDGPPRLSNILPGEGFEPIRYSSMDKDRCWFWHPLRECDFMSPQMIVDRLNQCNSGNANYLLSVDPDIPGSYGNARSNA